MACFACSFHHLRHWQKILIRNRLALSTVGFCRIARTYRFISRLSLYKMHKIDPTLISLRYDYCLHENISFFNLALRVHMQTSSANLNDFSSSNSLLWINLQHTLD
jgi:hypothetical protein